MVHYIIKGSHGKFLNYDVVQSLKIIFTITNTPNSASPDEMPHSALAFHLSQSTHLGDLYTNG